MPQVIQTKYQKLIIGIILSIVGITIYNVSSNVYSNPTFASSTEFYVGVEPNLQVIVPSDPTILSLKPTSDEGTFSNIDLEISAWTNNPTGYAMTMVPSYNDVVTTSLTRTAKVGDEDVYISTLPTKTGGYTLSEFTNLDMSALSSSNIYGVWGYQVKSSSNTNAGVSSNYLPMAESINLGTTSNAVSSTPTTINFGAKVTPSQPQGSYGITLTFTAVANYVPATSFNEAFANNAKIPITIDGQKYYTMQDMNSTICSEVPSPETNDTSTTKEARLVDIRDHKIYWVAKLLDGNCWMTSDLNIGGNTQLELSSINTDIESTTILPAVQTTNDVTWATGWLDAEAAATYRIYSNSEYGNFYNWYTATGGTGDVTSQAGDAPGSICPKGFKLPTGTNWDELINVYNINAENAENILNAPINLSNYGLYLYDAFWNSFLPAGVTIYWSSTSMPHEVSLVAAALDYDFNANYFSTNHPGAKVDGYKIRCLAR